MVYLIEYFFLLIKISLTYQRLCGKLNTFGNFLGLVLPQFNFWIILDRDMLVLR